MHSLSKLQRTVHFHLSYFLVHNSVTRRGWPKGPHDYFQNDIKFKMITNAMQSEKQTEKKTPEKVLNAI